LSTPVPVASARRRVATNTAVQIGGKAVVLALGAASLAILTRYLGPGEYGRLTLALMYMQIFTVLADIGLFTTVVREISRDPASTERLAGNALTLRLLLSIGMIGVAAGISLLLPYETDVRVAILLAGAAALWHADHVTGCGAAGAPADGPRGRGEVTGRATALALTALVAALDLGLYAVLGAATRGALVTLVVTFVVTRPIQAVRPLAEPDVWRWLLKASVPLGLALGINELYFRADTLIISLFEPFGQVGLYAFAWRVLEFTLALGTIVLTTVFPLLAEAVAHDEARALRIIQASTTCSCCWPFRSWPAGSSSRRRSSSWPRGRSSRTPQRRYRSCSSLAGCPGSTACSASRWSPSAVRLRRCGSTPVRWSSTWVSTSCSCRSSA
jgi:O-antigen/teichoic acid export membrane protein